MFDASEVLSNALSTIDGIIAETEMEIKNSIDKYEKNEKKIRLKELLDGLIELNKDEDLFDIDSRKKLLNLVQDLGSNRQISSKKETNNYYSESINKQLLESELSVLKDQIEAQQDKIKEYEVKISELQAQLLITENSYQEILKQKFNVDDEKSSLINELSRIKTINDDKIRLLESEISFFKKTLLERETEIASLRLYLAKLVRASNYLIAENELDSVPSLSRSSDSLSKKNNEKLKNHLNLSDGKPPIAPRNYFNNQPQFKDSSLTGSFTMPSTTSSKLQINNNFNLNNLLQNQFVIKSSTPILNERCLSPINRLDLATSKEQLEHLEELCKQNDYSKYFSQINQSEEDSKQFHSIQSSYPNYQINYLNHQFNQSPNSTCSTPNRSAKSSSSTSQNNSLPKSADDSRLAYLSSSKNSNPDLARHAMLKDFDLIIGKENQKSKGGLKWFFDKMKNKNHHHLSSQNGLSFSRTSLRATIGPQIRSQKIFLNTEFNSWDSSNLAEWFGFIGLGNYSESVLHSMLNGEQLASLNDVQLEKLFSMKNHFHRKKLRLALQILNRTADELTMQASRLDYVCVAKWLDDIGLSQYKELFLENRIDGPVLHHLSVEDLCRLKINTQLHHSSIKTGILVLRMNCFNQNCLIRRASPNSVSNNNLLQRLNNSENSNQSNSFNIESTMHIYNPAEVSLWTSYRVMEWLRSIDLAEFAANLRGSGVHGGLIVYEDTFNSNVLATLLSIPINKTLLRRHISTYFVQLIGYEIGERKRNYQEKTGSAQLSAFTKVKLSKKSNFRNSFRKKKNETAAIGEDSYLCPLITSSENHISYTNNSANLNNSNNLNCSNDLNGLINNLSNRACIEKTRSKNCLENLDSSLTNEINYYSHDERVKNKQNHPILNKNMSNNGSAQREKKKKNDSNDSNQNVPESHV